MTTMAAHGRHQTGPRAFHKNNVSNCFSVSYTITAHRVRAVRFVHFGCFLSLSTSNMAR